MNKEIDMNSDSFKIALMNTSFAFNPATHANWADVSANEIASGNGYTTGGQVLLSGELAEIYVFVRYLHKEIPPLPLTVSLAINESPD